jgi:hypothetical protein
MLRTGRGKRRQRRLWEEAPLSLSFSHSFTDSRPHGVSCLPHGLPLALLGSRSMGRMLGQSHPQVLGESTGGYWVLTSLGCAL